MLPNADVVKVVPDVLLAMIDSLRQQFYPRMRQAGRDRTISDSHRKGYSYLMFEKYEYDSLRARQTNRKHFRCFTCNCKV